MNLLQEAESFSVAVCFSISFFIFPQCSNSIFHHSFRKSLLRLQSKAAHVVAAGDSASLIYNI